MKRFSGRRRIGTTASCSARPDRPSGGDDRRVRRYAMQALSRGMPLLLLAAWPMASASGANDLCRTGERVVFSCAVVKGRVVSVCRSAGALRADSALAYRFGRPGQPELVFPATRVGSLQQFRFAHYFRSQTDRTELSFATAAASYAVYDYFEGDEKPQASRGVRVGVGGRDLDLPCIGPVDSRLVELEPVVPCDADSALANCR